MKNPIALIALVALLAASKPAPVATMPVATVTASTTLTTSNHVVISTGGAITLTLPSAAANPGLTFIIANHGTGTIAFSPAIRVANAETLSAIPPNLGGNVITIISDGTDYRLIGQ